MIVPDGLADPSRGRDGRRLRIAVVAACLLSVSVARAADLGVTGGADASLPERAHWPRLSSGPLQDNSFLIEEAYNQERGVVQHILTMIRDRESGAWQAVFTLEAPAPDTTHQVSFTVPYSWNTGNGEHDGVGDVLLNYRYQLLLETASNPAVAPRLSLILPTGSVDGGRGDGTTGVQMLLPASKQWSEHFAAHLNAGFTVLPHARAAHPSRSADLVSWTTGASLIWEPFEAINLLTEILVTDDAEIAERGVRHTTRVILDPGVRVGWNGPWGVQWVGGVGVPIGLRGGDDLALFLYFSAEHAVTAAARAARDW